MNKRRLFLAAVALAGAGFSANSQDNQWIVCNPSFNPTDRYPGATFSSYNGWACIKYESRDSAILAWRMILDSRRHNGIYANGLVLYSLKNNRIDLVCASNYAGGTYDPAPAFALMPEFATDSTPCPRHPYDALAYVDSLNAVYMLLGATPRVVNYEASPSVTPRDLWDAYTLDMLSTWKFDFLTRKWRRIPSSIRRFWGDYYCGACVPFHDNHLFYWKKTHKLLFVAGTGKHVATMDLTTETWDTMATVNAAPFALGPGLSAWDEKRDCAVFRLREKVCRFDPNTATWSSLPDCGLDPTASDEVYTGIASIPGHDAYLAVGRAGTTRVFDCGNNVWSTIAQGSIGLDANDGAIYLAYDVSTDNLILSTERSGTYGGFRRFHYVPSGVAVDPGRSGGLSGRSSAGNVLAGSRAVRIEIPSMQPENTCATVTIYRVDGSLMLRTSFESRGTVSIPLGTCAPGIYLVKITGRSGCFYRRIVIN